MRWDWLIDWFGSGRIRSSQIVEMKSVLIIIGNSSRCPVSCCSEEIPSDTTTIFNAETYPFVTGPTKVYP